MRGDKECPFSGVTNYGRVSRKGAGKWGLECSGGVITMTLVHAYSDLLRFRSKQL